jgi:hypothetical protein
MHMQMQMQLDLVTIRHSTLQVREGSRNWSFARATTERKVFP